MLLSYLLVYNTYRPLITIGLGARLPRPSVVSIICAVWFYTRCVVFGSRAPEAVRPARGCPPLGLRSPKALLCPIWRGVLPPAISRIFFLRPVDCSNASSVSTRLLLPRWAAPFLDGASPLRFLHSSLRRSAPGLATIGALADRRLADRRLVGLLGALLLGAFSLRRSSH